MRLHSKFEGHCRFGTDGQALSSGEEVLLSVPRTSNEWLDGNIVEDALRLNSLLNDTTGIRVPGNDNNGGGGRRPTFPSPSSHIIRSK